MYLNLKVNNNHSCQQHSWCNLFQFSNVFTLISVVVILIIWDDDKYIIVVYKAVSSIIMSLAVAATLTEMFWHITTFWKECHFTFLTVNTINRNQHALTLNQNYINVQQLMSSYLSQCNIVLYEQNIVTEQSKNGHCLKEVNIQSKLLLINSKNRINISVCKSKNNNISIV